MENKSLPYAGCVSSGKFRSKRFWLEHYEVLRHLLSAFSTLPWLGIVEKWVTIKCGILKVDTSVVYFTMLISPFFWWKTSKLKEGRQKRDKLVCEPNGTIFLNNVVRNASNHVNFYSPAVIIIALWIWIIKYSNQIIRFRKVGNVQFKAKEH